MNKFIALFVAFIGISDTLFAQAQFKQSDEAAFKIIKAEEDSSTLRIELPNKYDTNKVVQRTKLPNGELIEFYNYKPDESDEINFYLDAKVEKE